MAKEWGVKVVYRNVQMDPVYEKTYTLEEYCEMLRGDLLRLITDVEDMAYEANGGKQKEEWTDSTWEAFCKIKHKILDKAGDISRLSDNLFEKQEGVEHEEEKVSGSFSGFVAKVLKRV